MLIQGIKWICSKVNKEEHLRTEIWKKVIIASDHGPTGSQYKHGKGLSKI